MAEFLRGLAGRPLGDRLARAVLAAGLAVTAGFCLLVGLGLVGRHGASPNRGGVPEPRTGSAPIHIADPTPRTAPRAKRRRQDAQDRPGTVTHRRAIEELATHRALQHVPYRRAGVSIELVGARGDHAVLRVSADTVAAARRGWLAFLHSFADSGRTYLPIFEARGAW